MQTFHRIYLEITNRCNLSCAFCPGTRRSGGFITPQDFRLLAGRLQGHTRYLLFHLMGEPLLHPQLDTLLDIAGELGFRVVLTTNGTLLPRCQQTLLAAPALEKVSISLHSFEGNDAGPCLEGYLEGCLAFAQACARAGKRCILRLWNLDGPATQGANQQNEAILQRLREVFPQPWVENWQGTRLAPGVYLEWGERFEWPDLSAAPQGEGGFCHGLRDHIGVLWDGTVVPCCLDHEGDIPLGSLYRQTLEEILASPRAQAIYRGFSQRQAVEPLCLRCPYRLRFGS